jgi:hypothetical protein
MNRVERAQLNRSEQSRFFEHFLIDRDQVELADYLLGSAPGFLVDPGTCPYNFNPGKCA